MAAGFNDMYYLSQDSGFTARVGMSLTQACVSIGNEGSGVSFHAPRAAYAQAVLNNPSNFLFNFARAAAVDATVIGLATTSGTVSLTSANSSSGGALVTDAAISNAISAAYNSFLPGR